MPKLKPGSEFPSDWSDREDRDLLRGIYKHGFGNFVAIVKDKELCFRGRYRIAPRTRRDGRDDGDGDEDEQNDGDKAEEDDDLELFKEGLPMLPSFKLLTGHAKRMLWSIADPSYRPGTSTESGRTRLRKGRAPRVSSDGAASSEAAKVADNAEGDAYIDSAAPSALSQAARRRERREQWSKKEYSIIYKLVTSFGLAIRQVSSDEGGEKQWEYDFDWVKAHGKLNQKNIDQIRAKYSELVTMASRVVAYHNAGALEDKRAHLTLTLIQAKRILERVAVFAQVRRKILSRPDSELESSLTTLASKGVTGRWATLVPAWWIPVTHDIGFVKVPFLHIQISLFDDSRLELFRE